MTWNQVLGLGRALDKGATEATTATSAAGTAALPTAVARTHARTFARTHAHTHARTRGTPCSDAVLYFSCVHSILDDAGVIICTPPHTANVTATYSSGCPTSKCTHVDVLGGEWHCPLPPGASPRIIRIYRIYVCPCPRPGMTGAHGACTKTGRIRRMRPGR